MRTVVGLAVLALVDLLLAGFRSAAGRDGRIRKASYYREAIRRGAIAGTIVVTLNAVAVWALVATAAEPAATSADLLRAGDRCVAVFGVFATVILLAVLFWFAPARELRIVPTLVVLGPLTLLRPLVIAAGLAYAAAEATGWQAWAAAILAGGSMLGVERVLGVRYAARWRRLA